METKSSPFKEKTDIIEKVLTIKRVAKVVKGGRRFSFSALVVAGNPIEGKVGFGLGKAKEITSAIKKGTDVAKGTMIKVNTFRATIPYAVEGRFSASRIIMKPAAPGTGVIASYTVKTLMECAGITDIITKSVGSNTSINMLKAAFDGLCQLESYDDVAARRGKSLKELFA